MSAQKMFRDTEEDAAFLKHINLGHPSNTDLL